MHRKILFAGAMLALATTGMAGAEDANLTDATQLDRLVVTTPLRRESSLERGTSSVTVIDEQEIARAAAVDLPSLLKSMPGVNVTSGGGMGAVSSLSMRGATAAQSLVLVDGVNIRSATLGTVALHNIPLAAIERIEIARGPHSAQYGADAIGGVINIITKKGSAACPEGKEHCTTVSAGILHPWGGYGDVSLHGVAPDGTRFNLGGRLIGTEGYDFTLPGNPSHEPDHDGFLLGSLTLSAERDFAWGLAYGSALYSRSRGGFDRAPDVYDAAPANEADYATLAARLGARIDHGEDWSSRIEFSLGRDEQSNFRRNSATRDEFNTLRYGLLASTTREFDLGGARHILTLGGEAVREEIESSGYYDVTARNQGAVFAQHSIEIAALTLDGGIRHDSSDMFGSATTYNLGASYEFVPGLVGRASYGTGFRAPTFNDLYWPADAWTSGNPDLTPERSRSYEVGLSWRPTDGTVLDLAFYQSWVRDQINWQTDPVSFISMPVNIDRVETTGFEASIAHRFNDRWRGRAWFDVRNPRDQNGFPVLRQERLKVGAELGYRPVDALELTLGVLHVGPRDDTDLTSFLRTELPAYTLVDFGAVYSFDDHARMKLSVSNLLDEQYSTNWGYRAPGRGIELSFTRTF